MEDRKFKIKQEQLHLLNKNSSLAILASLVNTIFLAFLNREMIKPSLLITWVTISLIIIFSRFMFMIYFNKSSFFHKELSFKGMIIFHASGLFLSGFALSFLIYLMPGEEIKINHLLYFLIIGGMIAGAVGSYSSHKSLFYFYSLPLIVPIIFNLIYRGSEIFIIIGIIFTIFTMIMSITFESSHKSIFNSLLLKHENNELIHFLEDYKNQLESLNENLITEIKEKEIAQEVLADNEKKFRNMFRKNTAMMLLVNMISEEIEDANDAAINFFGLPMDELLHKKIRDIDIENKMHDLHLVSFDKDSAQEPIVFPTRAAGGKIRTIELKNSPILLNDQYYFFVIVNDVTAKTVYEEKLKLYESAFENIYEAIIITDKDRKIIDVNRAFTRITGYTRSDVLGKNPSFLASGKHDVEFYEQMNQKLAKSGFWEGEIWNKTRDGRLYPELLSISSITDKHGNVTHYFGTFTDISRIKDTEHKLKKQAQIDNLTGLPNRYSLNLKLEELMGSSLENPNKKFAIFFIDLDHFKEINDTMGHDAGDALLQGVALRLKSTLRQSDFIARMGGDEFLAIIDNFNDSSILELLAEKILHSIQTPFLLLNEEKSITTSIGISIYPDHAVSISALLKNADQAMYDSKTSKRNSYSFFRNQSPAI